MVVFALLTQHIYSFAALELTDGGFVPATRNCASMRTWWLWCGSRTNRWRVCASNEKLCQHEDLVALEGIGGARRNCPSSLGSGPPGSLTYAMSTYSLTAKLCISNFFVDLIECKPSFL
jgi:hypothetical protein